MKLLKKDLQIAIDGPVGSGKSIAAKRLAKKLGLLFINTGAMYRAVAWIGVKKGLDLKKEAPLMKYLKGAEIKLIKPSKKDRVCDVLINGKNVTDELYSTRIHWGSSQVGVFPKVRKLLVKLQQDLAQKQAVVMEGRDIGTVVLPQADLKIYMTAEVEVRARRRHKDLIEEGEKKTFEEVLEGIKKRDYRDTNRQAGPLTKAKGAWELDTSQLSIDEEVNKIIKKLQKTGLVA